ncbi:MULTISPECIES: hypothetical protein [Mesorhizobium]|uniref:hypothetical protein n=1 Tax=Mesorhizobium TaxID=68287 RepID=UPI0007EC9630|nr:MULTISPECIES: hypothetical protein [Mesorhizobium]MCA0002912.1 hypothetical protein [Mesorhizobium sp. B264B2A]MCA0009198.1 hypothetical protein [Mesorhizobium sp. B264B1B]MCA0014001.1 hypothetical protein [Mesorhizobium sp. B294B1A1]MCA0018749.1 hypothetical protein [Mesorhizobium sp. B264B1A]MCA0023264.1 hypothetical protein [Mesorhizobium sp. B263B1A]
MATKILALTDPLGTCVLRPPSGGRFDTGFRPRIEGVAFGDPIADTGFNINTIIADLNERGARIAIQHDPRRALPPPLDLEASSDRELLLHPSVWQDNSNQSFEASIDRNPGITHDGPQTKASQDANRMRYRPETCTSSSAPRSGRLTVCKRNTCRSADDLSPQAT